MGLGTQQGAPSAPFLSQPPWEDSHVPPISGTPYHAIPSSSHTSSSEHWQQPGSAPVQGVPAYGLLPPCALTGSSSAPRFVTAEYVMHEHVRVCAHDVMIPDRVICPSCRTTVTPCPHKESGACSWLAAGAMCLLGCAVCFWLPFCCNSTKDTVYACPVCEIELYRLRR